MEKNEIMNKIKEIVYKTIGIQIEDENDNILGCHHKYPVYMRYMLLMNLKKYMENGYSRYLRKMTIIFGNYQI